MGARENTYLIGILCIWLLLLTCSIEVHGGEQQTGVERGIGGRGRENSQEVGQEEDALGNIGPDDEQEEESYGNDVEETDEQDDDGEDEGQTRRAFRYLQHLKQRAARPSHDHAKPGMYLPTQISQGGARAHLSGRKFQHIPRQTGFESAIEDKARAMGTLPRQTHNAAASPIHRMSNVTRSRGQRDSEEGPLSRAKRSLEDDWGQALEGDEVGFGGAMGQRPLAGMGDTDSLDYFQPGARGLPDPMTAPGAAAFLPAAFGAAGRGEHRRVPREMNVGLAPQKREAGAFPYDFLSAAQSPQADPDLAPFASAGENPFGALVQSENDLYDQLSGQPYLSASEDFQRPSFGGGGGGGVPQWNAVEGQGDGNQGGFGDEEEDDEFCGDQGGLDSSFLQMLKHGLPTTNGRGEGSVIVVGAGISGLVAADLLRNAGYNVTIYEASDRVGGRIQTWRSLGEGWMGELGPMRIPKTQKFTRHLIRRFQIQMSKFQTRESYSKLFLSQTKAERMSVFKTDLGRQHFYRDYGIPPNETSKAPATILTEVFEKALKDMNELDWRDFVARYDNFSLRGYLEKFGVSDSMVDLMGPVANNEAITAIGMIEFVMDECLFKQDLDQIMGGFDLLPRSFRKILEKDIVFNAKVKSVQYSRNHASVQLACDGVNCPAMMGQTYVSDYVVWTPTAPATLSADFLPPLPVDKRTALRKVHYETSTKVLLVFNTAFWEEQSTAQRKGGHVFTDLPIQSLYYPSQTYATNGKAVLLASYTWGPHARRQTGMSDKDLIEECLKAVAMIHNLGMPDVRRMFVTGHVKKWATDPYALGAFVFSYPHHFRRIQDDLAKPAGYGGVNRLFFAGEHTEFPHAWMDTAIKSGVRAAAEIHLGKDYTLERGYRYNQKPLTERRRFRRLRNRQEDIDRKHHPNSIFEREITGW